MALRASNHHNVDLNSPRKVSSKPRSKKTIEETFTKVSQLEHILLRPDTYVGSVERVKSDTWVWDESENRMKYKTVVYPPGLYKIFDEILVNAADHKQRDPSMNMIKVEIDTENQLISVWNNGSGIPVEMHQKEGVYVPELIFGHLLTSSNYDDNEKKVVGGRNGYGAKLANIFSTEFIVETADSQRGKRYKQTFRNNMSEKDDPIIKANSKKESFTKITFSPDLSRFGMLHFEDDVVALLKKRVYDIAGVNSGLKVYLNGSKLPIKSFKEYVALYPRDESAGPILCERISDRWEVAIAPSEGQLNQVSFVNSIWTIKGGTHVNHVADQVANKISDHIEKKHKGMKVKAFQIKSQLSLFINCLIENPAFDSQTKETLTTKPPKFGSKWSFSDELSKKVLKSVIVENVLDYAKFKQSKDLAKTDGGKKARVHGIAKLDDANKAGGREASKCTLILTEGDSAKSLAISGLSVVGRDYYGVFPLKGKLLNVREAKHKQIMDNAEINNLKKILGLQHKKAYTADTIKSLRYGHVLIMADQDHDGSHIKGLVINFFDHFWPSLLKIDGFLQEFITPIVKCSKGKENKIFFTLPEYKRWISSAEGVKGWKPKYYKGLGTSTPGDAKSYFSNLPRHLHEFRHHGDEDEDSIELAFSKQRIADRKDWLASYVPGTYFDHEVDELSYSNFVNKELILFSLADNARSIPSVIDGLKPSQRKVLFACFKRKLSKTEIKVAQLAGYVAEHAAYHHGEASLQSTIVGLAQNFVGSNNANLLVPAGQFGTRLQGGKDAASSRYTFTKLAPITRALFPELDDPLLSYLEDDGLSIEPDWYCPVIPTVLLNGSDGIGTGWSSSVPCYNPRDLIFNIRKLLAGEALTELLPWYRGFKGSIIPVDNSKSFDVYGVLQRSSEDGSLRVKELPIRSWTTPYKEFLEANVVGNSDAKAPFIKDFHDNSTENKVDFTISVSNGASAEVSTPAAYKKLKLTTTLTTSNMVLFDAEGRIRKYDTPAEIVQEFFDVRIEMYDKRRSYLLGELEHELKVLDNKKRFITMVVDGKLKVAKRKKVELMAELKRLNFDPIEKKNKKAVTNLPVEEDENEEDEEEVQSTGLEKGYDYLLSMPLWSLTMERVKQLSEQRSKKEEERDAMEATTPRQLWEADLDRLEEAIEQDEIEAKAHLEDLERVAKQARNRQRGKGRKGKAAQYVEEEDNLDFEVVPLPEARAVVPKKPRVLKGKTEVGKKSAKASVTGSTKPKKSSQKTDADEMILDSDYDSEGSDDDDLVDLLEDDDDGSDSPANTAKNDTEPGLEEDGEMLENDLNALNTKAASNNRTKASKKKAAPSRRKKPITIIESDEDDAVPNSDENASEPEMEETVVDDLEDDDIESMSLSQRFERRLKLTSAPKTSVAIPRGNARKNTGRPKKQSKSIESVESVESVSSQPKRPRETQKKSILENVASPSPSPKSKKTRVKSPSKPKKGGAKARGKKKVIEEEEEDDFEIPEELEPTPPPARPQRRRRAVVERPIVVDSDDSYEEDDDFIVPDDASDIE